MVTSWKEDILNRSNLKEVKFSIYKSIVKKINLYIHLTTRLLPLLEMEVSGISEKI